MSAGPSNSHGRQQAPARPGSQLPVRAYFTTPECDHVARLRNVWGLVGWYHATVVAPQLSFRGMARRAWYIVTGRRWKLMSPWEQLALKIQHAELVAAREALESAQQREGGSDA